MTRIAHLADLHFGSVPEGLAEALAADLAAISPTLIVIAGDLTLNASTEEFAAAKAWLDGLAPPRLVVPGNHDLRSWNLWDRFLAPYRRFDRALGVHRHEMLDLHDCVVFALDTTARWQPRLAWQEGRVRRRDAVELDRGLREAPSDKVKIIVAHHPFAPVEGMPRARPVRRALNALDIFARREVALILSGHTHQSYVVPVAHGARRLFAVGAPTALSKRRRGEENGYWIIDIEGRRVTLTLRLRNETAFTDRTRQAIDL